MKLSDASVKKPQRYPKVERRLPTMEDKGWTRVGGVQLRENLDLMPQPGLQEQVLACDCNLIFMAGSATMGKTFSGFMKALQGLGRQNYTARLISKRLQDSKKGGSIIRDAKLIFDGFAGTRPYSSSMQTSTPRIQANGMNTRITPRRANRATSIGMSLPKYGTSRHFRTCSQETGIALDMAHALLHRSIPSMSIGPRNSFDLQDI